MFHCHWSVLSFRWNLFLPMLAFYKLRLWVIFNIVYCAKDVMQRSWLYRHFLFTFNGCESWCLFPVCFSCPHTWYPLARRKRRRVFLHVGPTNSGKTYQALKQLQSSASGKLLLNLLKGQWLICNVDENLVSWVI